MEYNISHYFFLTRENELFSEDLAPFYYDTEFIAHTKHKCRFLLQQRDELLLQAACGRCSRPAAPHGVDEMSQQAAMRAMRTCTSLSCLLPPSLMDMIFSKAPGWFRSPTAVYFRITEAPRTRVSGEMQSQVLVRPSKSLPSGLSASISDL